MRLLAFLSPLLVVPFVLADSVESIQKQLVDLAAAGNGLITLDPGLFDLLTTAKRTWSATIQFTALDQRRRCTPCKEFDPSWVAVAKAWATTPKEHRDDHFFATLDFDNGQRTFQQLGLTSAPVVFVYPPTQGPRQAPNGRTSPAKLDFSNGFEAEPLAAALSSHTPIPIPYKAPINWSRWGSFAMGLLAFVMTLRFISPIVQSRWTWAIGTLLTILTMVSGFMFTRIRNSPYAAGNGQWIAAGYQNQYGQEVQVIGALYGVLAATILVLVLVVPKQASPARQRIQIYAFTFATLAIYSILVSIFRVKNKGYPFKLLF